MTKDDIFKRIVVILHETFDLDPEQIRPESQLGADLDIDSIDAVDLIDHIKRQTGKKIAAEEFKAVRTVGDVVEAVYQVVNTDSAAS